MKTVGIKGGLGNQLFQYSYAMYLKEKYYEEVRIDPSSYWRDRLRSYQLDHYKISLKKSSLLGQLGNLVKTHQLMGPNQIYTSKDAFSEVSVDDEKKYSFFNAEFQNIKYASQVKSRLLCDLVYKKPIISSYLCIFRKLMTEDATAIHVRRGDFLKLTGYKCIDLTYYQKAIEIISAQVRNPVFYVFSDDIGWCKKTFRSLKGTFQYVDADFGLDDILQFEMMRLCKSFIIANSTYSFWASFLSECKKKIMIAPKDWYTVEEANARCRAGLLKNAYYLI